VARPDKVRRRSYPTRIGKMLLGSPAVARRAPALRYFGEPVITFCRFTARPAAQHTILVRTLQHGGDARAA
jgi:hypothetical protein